MKRSIGVTISANIVLISSLLWVGLGALAVALILGAPSLKINPSHWVAMIPFWIFAIFSCLGIVTGIGLFRLKRWARVSILIFAMLLVFMGSCGLFWQLLIAPVMKVPPTTQVQFFVLFVCALILTVGGWWLHLFNKSSVKTQFFPTLPVENTSRATGRPLSITIMALLFLFGAIQSLFYIRRSWPEIFFGLEVTGWPGAALSVATAAFCLYMGVGLLRLNEAVRRLAISYLIYGIGNVLLFVILQGAQDRFATSMASLSTEISIGKSSYLRISAFILLSTAILNITQIWLLVTRRWAFNIDQTITT